MITKTFGGALYGVEAQMITIEVNIVNGLGLYMVGLPDNAIKESQHRIESVLKHIGKQMPRRRVIVNLAPASIRKEGASYDLPIALAILQASQQAKLLGLNQYMIMGELALDGSLRPIRGALPIAIAAKKKQLKGFILPKENAQQVAIISGLPIIPIHHIKEAIAYLEGKKDIPPLYINPRQLFQRPPTNNLLDLSDVYGQQQAKRALQIAAAGSHNILMIGPPGAGKTMLAKRLPSILPPLKLQEALETTKIYSVTSQINQKNTLHTTRPFRTPHHTISDVALAGGGSIPQPGEISLAHNGVLFLDELPEFKRTALEVLRQPLETKHITITRAQTTIDFPANFMLIASMNPCPCGYYTHPDKNCLCSPLARRRYLNKISGPLLDRIDLHIELMPLQFTNNQETPKETNMHIKKNVLLAKEKQYQRFQKYPKIYANATIPPGLVKKLCYLDPTCTTLLNKAMKKLELSGRAYHKIHTVARTIADLESSASIKKEHIAEAIFYRSLDRESWTG